MDLQCGHCVRIIIVVFVPFYILMLLRNIKITPIVTLIVLDQKLSKVNLIIAHHTLKYDA